MTDDHKGCKILTLRGGGIVAIPGTSFGWFMGTGALLALAVCSFISWVYHPEPRTNQDVPAASTNEGVQGRRNDP